MCFLFYFGFLDLAKDNDEAFKECNSLKWTAEVTDSLDLHTRAWLA